MKLEDLFKLELHETLRVDKYTVVLRVPGGWIYDSSSEFGTYAVFVPEPPPVMCLSQSEADFHIDFEGKKVD